MKAWLVVNAFLNQTKFNEIHQWLYDAGRNHDVEIEIKSNAQLISACIDGELALNMQAPMVDFVLFWDKDVLLAKTLEDMGYRVFNSSFAIEVCDNKSLTHIHLAKEHIPMPDTIMAPMTYANIGYSDMEFLQSVEKRLGFPMVVKESFGSFGQQVYLCKDLVELERLVKKLEGKSFLFQKFIKEAECRDYRLQVVGDKVVAAMERTAKNGDFRANITNGGSMKQYVPTKEEEQLAVKCCEILKADFAGVDLMKGEDGKVLVCEVNSNAHFKNIFDCTGVNTADYIMEHLLSVLERHYS